MSGVDMDGVRERVDDGFVELSEVDGRPVVEAWSEGGCNRTAVDLIDLVAWLRKNRPELLMLTVTGDTSDGYHTFNELYEHRAALFLALCNEVEARTAKGYVWRSLKHFDGSMFEGWFIMGIGVESGDQITYHLPMSRWEDAAFAAERTRAPLFDGHTPADVLQRLRRFFT